MASSSNPSSTSSSSSTTSTPSTSWGGSKRVPPPTNFSPAHWRRGREGRAPNSAGVSGTRNSATASQNVSRMPSPEWGWETTPDPTSTFAKVMRSTDEGSSASSSSASPWSAPFTASSTVASTATDTRPGSTASSTTNASGSALAVETSAHNAPVLDASTSSAPVVTKIFHLAPGPRAEPSASASASDTTSAPGAATSILFGGLYLDPSLAWREEVRPRPFDVLPTRATAPSASTAIGVAPGSSASATALCVAPSSTTYGRGRGRCRRPNLALVLDEKEWPRLGTNPATAKKSGGSRQNSADVSQPRDSGVSQHVTPLLESGWKAAPDPRSTFAPVMRSTEVGSSSSSSPWSAPFTASSTVASTPTDSRPASTASSTTTPSRDSTLVPNVSGSPPAVETSAHTATGPGASTSAAPVVKTIANLPLEHRTLTSASSSALGATTSTPVAAPIIPVLRDSWVAQDRGTPTRSVERHPGQQAFGGIAPYLNPVWTYRPEEPRPFFVRLCCHCHREPAAILARPCGHLILCVRCYNSWFFCPCCGVPAVTVYKDPVWTYRREEVGCWECGLLPALYRVTPCGHLAICELCYQRRFVCSYCGDPVTTWL